ncbi:ABC transporter permease [Microbacterium sp. ET2]|uniref:ABC transporter permease n=1 Tax=Microbacterium albipurpureum TaxID=3050384 RepID=UPI00259D26CC|nr:ABC transporter permease [Microbacterium sp. ET2 (Ac-2212)]WJL94775.1 ABC transporter permease [Microbacterium sp. ET2 (Ac-2212)]
MSVVETTAPSTATDAAEAPASGGFSAGIRRHWWLLRTILLAAVNLLVFVFVSFFLVKLIPGDPVVTATGGRLTGADLEEARASYGLDGSVGEQLLTYLGSLARLDLGTSIATGRPIAEDLATRIPATLELVFTGLLAASVVALLLSHYVVTHRANRVSRILLSYARSAGALPEYVIGIAFIYLFFAVLGWAPAPSGRLDPMLLAPPQVTGFPILDALITGDTAAAASYASRLALPVIVMMVAHAPLLMKTLIINLDHAIDEPSTRFRIASGAPRRSILLSVYRRALPSVVAMLGMMFGLLLGGAIVLESLFALGGLGQYAVDAVNASDVFALRSFLLVVAAMCLAIYLIVDILTMTLDPRRRVETGKGA